MFDQWYLLIFEEKFQYQKKTKGLKSKLYLLNFQYTQGTDCLYYQNIKMYW